ncbi:MAG: ecdysteroid 22-kinase family protein [Chloroflexota bacterium]|nr:ecdysteroid 22-kinase family protein [Chloroflexota bacterium]
MSQLALPDGPEEITPEWFTVVFREDTIITTGAVVGVQTEIIGQEQGFTGVIARVHLQYTDYQEAAPSSVVVKFPTATASTPSAYRAAQSQDVMATRRYFERCAREVFFYQKVASLSAFPVPRLYYGAVDSGAGRVILVLEDLCIARVGDALRGCTVQDATLVIDQLASFHAQWWNHPQLETFSWLPMWGGDSQDAQSRYRQLLDLFLQRFGQRVPRPVLEAIDALATSYGDIRSRLQRAPVTMIHGDLHLDNLLFSPFEYTPGVTLIDWQSVARGRGVIDLALFLFGSLETTMRRTVEGDLLRRYHELLLARGVTGYGFPHLIEDCRLVLLWLLGAKVVWLGSLDMESLSGRELALVNASLTEDSFAAFLDHDAGSLFPL